MSLATVTPNARSADLLRFVLFSIGLWQLMISIAQLVAPFWFYSVIGLFPPFNRHYLGDLGAFSLPLGLGLIAAARDPLKHRLMIRLALVGNLLHVLNHSYDALGTDAALHHWAVDVGPLLVFCVLLLVIERSYAKRPARA